MLLSNKLKSFINKHLSFDNLEVYKNDISINKSKSDLKKNILFLQNINDSRYINKLFEKINMSLIDNGLFIGKVVTYPDRRNDLFAKYPLIISRFLYILDLIFNRIIPKIPFTKKIYFALTKGRARVLSKAETYGRLYSCGFEIIDEKTFDFNLWFVAKKITQPYFDHNPTYGALITLNRIGKNYKEFNVYKLRTMHPYSEYLQEYMFEKNNLKDGGKINDDFRITPEGKILRKFWIDEIPMLLNLFKGEMKIVGVRPLSKHYFNLYDKEIQEMRVKNKPGLIPPFYADMPITFEEIMISEKKYLEEYTKSPFLTDLKYLYKALINIFFKRKRSG